MSIVAQMTVSVIIPVRNGGANFRSCLSRLVDAAPPPYEIIVVVDGDMDGSWQVAEEFGTQVLRLPSRCGPARARNVGACRASGDLLFFVDADVMIPLDAINQVALRFEREPGLSAIIGSYDDEPAAPNFLSQYKNLLHHYTHQTAREEASTFWAACGAIRRDVFMAVGGFDESYRRPSIEDIELGYRLRQAGHRIRLCKTLQVKHLKHWGVYSLLRADFLYRAVPWTELILRDRRLINDLNLRLSERMSVIFIYGLLGALAGAWWRPALLAAAALLMALLLTLNAPLYRFFRRKRGLVFAIGTVPWHWLYFFYSGLAVMVGCLRHLCKTQSVKTEAAAASQK